MFDVDQWLEVFATLRQNKLRSLMTASGVFWGVLMLVLMIGFGNGLRLGVQRNMFGITTNTVYLWGQRTRVAYRGLAPGRQIRFSNRDVESLEQVAAIEALSPRIQLGGWHDGINVSHGTKTGNFGVTGDWPQLAVVESIVPLEGRFINDLDIEQRRKVTVIGEDVEKTLYGRRHAAVGSWLTIRGVPFRVVGIVRSQRPGEQGDRDNSTLHVPLSTFQSAFNSADKIGWFAAMARPDVDAAELEQQVRRVVMSLHTVAPSDEHAIGSFNAGKAFQRLTRLFAGVRAFMWFVSIATLCAGALGVSNIMLISVKERTREIGIRKALGATPASVVLLVLKESLALTSLAGYLGLVVGVALLQVAEPALSRTGGPLGPPYIDFSVALIASGVLLLVGLVSGAAPARHAANIRPVEALRSE